MKPKSLLEGVVKGKDRVEVLFVVKKKVGKVTMTDSAARRVQPWYIVC